MFLLFSLFIIKWKCGDRKCSYETGSINVPLDYNNENTNFISLNVKKINSSSDLNPPVIVLSNGAGSSNIDLQTEQYKTNFKDTVFYFVGYRGIDSNLTFNDKDYKSIIKVRKNSTNEKKLIKIATKTNKTLNLANFWVEQRAKDVIEFIKQENIPKCHLFAVGYSGSLIAQQLIGKYPEYFIRCAIVASSIPETNQYLTNFTEEKEEEINEKENIENIEKNEDDDKDNFENDEDESIYEDDTETNEKYSNYQNSNQKIESTNSTNDTHFVAISNLIERYRRKCLNTFGRSCKYNSIKWLDYDEIPNRVLFLISYKKDQIQWIIDHEMRNPETIGTIFDLLQSITNGATTPYIGFQTLSTPNINYKWLDIAMHLCAKTNDQTLLYPTGLEQICPYLPTIDADYDFNFSVPVLLITGEFDLHTENEEKEFYQKHMQKDLLTTLYLPNTVSLYSFQREDVNSAIEKFLIKGSKSFEANRFIEIQWDPPFSLSKTSNFTFKGGIVFTTLAFVIAFINSLKKQNNKQQPNKDNKTQNKQQQAPKKFVPKQRNTPKLKDRKRNTH